MWIQEDDLKAFPSKIRNEGKPIILDCKVDCINVDVFKQRVLRQLIPALDKFRKKSVVLFF